MKQLGEKHTGNIECHAGIGIRCVLRPWRRHCKQQSIFMIYENQRPSKNPNPGWGTPKRNVRVETQKKATCCQTLLLFRKGWTLALAAWNTLVVKYPNKTTRCTPMQDTWRVLCDQFGGSQKNCTRRFLLTSNEVFDGVMCADHNASYDRSGLLFLAYTGVLYVTARNNAHTEHERM